MATVSRKLTRTFMEFFRSERSSGILLIACTAFSLILTNTTFGPSYVTVWQTYVGGMSVEHWINDALMAVFFLLIGLELERQFYNGELSDIRNALLPVIAAAGGIAVPALIHFALNRGTDTQAGIGIPMATDIAFALGVLAILGSRIPASLKVFLTALAVIDDLGAIVVIAVFYTAKLSIWYLAGAAAVFGLLIVLNRVFRVKSLPPYVIGGVLMWFLVFRSGVHATIAGVLLAFTIPFSAVEDDEGSPSHILENFLHWPVAFVVLPIFALANTCIIIRADSMHEMFSANSAGIALGLVLGKPLGITILSFIAVAVGICRLPLDLNWKHIFGAGLLGGIGFTMSIFITNLAFAHRADIINSSKMAVLVASIVAGMIGLIFLKLFGRPQPADDDVDTMDFAD